jgi:transposase-like protein
MALDDPVLCERTDARQTERNGHRSLLLATQVGDNELKDPKAESWQFLPEPAGAEEAHRPGAVDRDRPGYVEGISTRSVDDPRVSADMVAAALRTVFVHSDPQGLSAARAPSGTH